MPGTNVSTVTSVTLGMPPLSSAIPTVTEENRMLPRIELIFINEMWVVLVGLCNMTTQQNAEGSYHYFYRMSLSFQKSSNVCASCKFANQSTILCSKRIIMKIRRSSRLSLFERV